MDQKKMTRDQITLYRRVAYYYYKDGLTQADIASRMNMSRQRVNRILKACLDSGLVQINIEGMEQTFLETESRLERRYRLREARVFSSDREENLLRDMGRAAGCYLKEIMQDGDIIGITRGTTTAAVVQYWTPSSGHPGDITVTQLMGSGAEEDSRIGADAIVYRLAEALGARANILHAPVIVHSREARDSFLSDPFFQSACQVMKQCRIALVGIGNSHSQSRYMRSLYDENDAAQTEWLKNVTGEVCTHFFDEDGQEVLPPFADQIIAVSCEDYRKIPIRVGIAGGPEKVEAIRAALRGEYVNVLITDSRTADSLLYES